MRLAIGVALLPVCVAATAGFVLGFHQAPRVAMEGVAFLVGFGAYLVLHFALYKPVFLHVVGHELTHALFSALIGGRVKTMQVSPKGGAVLVSKSNVLVALAPYFVPVYTLVAVLLFAVVRDPFRAAAAGVLGASLSFHLALTFATLKQHQPDLQEGGVVLSLALVYLANVVIVAAILSLVLPELFGFRSFLAGAWRAVAWAAQGVS